MNERLPECIKSLFAAFLVSALGFMLQRSRGFLVWHSLSDGLFCSFALFLGRLCLRFAANGGFFDIPGYGLRLLFSIHRPREEKAADFESFRAERMGNKKPVFHLVLAACICLFGSIFALIMDKAANL